MLTSARKEVVQSKKAVEVCQQEFASLKSESSLLQVQVAEKHKKITELEAQKKRLLADIDTHKKNEVKITFFVLFFFNIQFIASEKSARRAAKIQRHLRSA